jgi:hypothetical protein
MRNFINYEKGFNLKVNGMKNFLISLEERMIEKDSRKVWKKNSKREN